MCRDSAANLKRWNIFKKHLSFLRQKNSCPWDIELRFLIKTALLSFTGNFSKPLKGEINDALLISVSLWKIIDITVIIQVCGASMAGDRAAYFGSLHNFMPAGFDRINIACVYYYFLGLMLVLSFGIIFWSSSRCTLQSFLPNPGRKGFPLPSGLGAPKEPCFVLENLTFKPKCCISNQYLKP